MTREMFAVVVGVALYFALAVIAGRFCGLSERMDRRDREREDRP